MENEYDFTGEEERVEDSSFRTTEDCLVNEDAEFTLLYNLVINPCFFAKIPDFQDYFFNNSFFQRMYRLIETAYKNGKPVSHSFIREFFLKASNSLLDGGRLYDYFIDYAEDLEEKDFKRIVRELKILYGRREILKRDKESIKENKYIPECNIEDICNINLEKNKEILHLISQEDKKDDNHAALEVLEELEAESYFEKDFFGMETGFEGLNAITGGLKKGHFIVLGAPTGFGKTTIAINFMHSALKSLQDKEKENDKKDIILFFSLEMSARSIFDRMMAAHTGYSYNELKKRSKTEQKQELITKVKELMSLGVVTIDETDITITKIISEIETRSKDFNVRGVFIDYLQKLEIPKSDSNSRVSEVKELTKKLKNIAMKYNIPVFSLAQFNRAVFSREDKTPQITDFKDGSTIEQDADIVMLLYGKPKVATENKDPYYADESNITLDVAKNRDGKTGKIKLFHQKELFKFKEII